MSFKLGGGGRIPDKFRPCTLQFFQRWERGGGAIHFCEFNVSEAVRLNGCTWRCAFRYLSVFSVFSHLEVAPCETSRQPFLGWCDIDVILGYNYNWFGSSCLRRLFLSFPLRTLSHSSSLLKFIFSSFLRLALSPFLSTALDIIPLRIQRTSNVFFNTFRRISLFSRIIFIPSFCGVLCDTVTMFCHFLCDETRAKSVFIDIVECFVTGHLKYYRCPGLVASTTSCQKNIVATEHYGWLFASSKKRTPRIHVT